MENIANTTKEMCSRIDMQTHAGRELTVTRG